MQIEPITEKLSTQKKIGSLGSPSAFDIEQEVKYIIRVQLGIDESQMQNSASLTKDLGADNLDLAEIRNVINSEFEISLDYGVTETLLTVGDWITAVQNAVKPETINSEHEESLSVPYSTSPEISITFKCKLERKVSTHEITKVTEIKATSVSVTDHIYSGSTIVQTIKTSYSFKEGSSWLNYTVGGETKVTWNGEVTVEVTAGGATTKYKTILTHSAMVGESPVNITENSFTALEVVNPTNPTGPTNPTNPPQFPNSYRGRMERIIYERYDIETALIVNSGNLRDLAFDDLEFIELMMDIEDEFEISIYDEDAELILTIGDLYNFIIQHA